MRRVLYEGRLLSRCKQLPKGNGLNSKLVKAAPWIAGGLLIFAVGIVIWPGRTVSINEPITHPQINPPDTGSAANKLGTQTLGGTESESGAGTSASGRIGAALWQAVDPQDYQALPSLREDVNGARLFAVDRSRLDAVAVGNEITIAVPDGSDPNSDQLLPVAIETVVQTPSGNRVLTGVIDGDPHGRFVMTLGASAVFGTLSTRTGVYNLAGNEGLVWIIEGRALSQHVDPSLPDTVQAPVQ